MITARGIRKTFDDITALDRLDCTIRKSSIYGLIGSNGSGKSTLLRLFSGIYQPDQGEIQIDEQSVFENTNTKSRLYFLPDEPHFLANYSIQSMTRFLAPIYPNWSWEKFEKYKSIFPLDTSRSIRTFSKGMQKQAAIMLSLSSGADYYFFDETFDGLDPVMRQLVKRILMEEIAEYGKTVIMTSHNLRELEDMCDHIGLLHDGHIIFERDIDDLKLSIHKIQMAFTSPPEKSAFEGIDMLHFERRGSVIIMIARGDGDALLDRLRPYNPLILESIPLTLEEVFIYEMEVTGYDFSKVL